MHDLSNPMMTMGADGPIRVAVDLSSLRPGGENGGIKPFLFETLLWLGRQTETPLRFLYLTCAHTHAEVRDGLARLEDEVICVRQDGVPLPPGDGQSPRERLAVPPPLDLLWQLGAQVLYCPFGHAGFATPGIGTISTIVDVLHRDFPWTLQPSENVQREEMFQEIVRVADDLQCISRHVVARMREHYQVAEERMFTTYIAIHQRFTASTPDPAAAGANGTAQTAGSKPFFFFPANAWKHKNHETLLLAYGIYYAHALTSGTSPWPLLLTGHEDARWNELRDLTKTLGLLKAEAVTFRGYVPPDEFGQLWNAAGALVFPSLHEGFGIPLLEAMQHDLPVLTSGDGSLSEVGADACLYADARRPEALADAMTRLATEPDLRRSLVAKGRARRLEFSLARESGHLLAAIVKLVRQKPPYRPLNTGVSPDGWTEHLALLALPDLHSDERMPARLTLSFHPSPAPRQLRLRVGASVALGTFALPAFQANHEIAVGLRPCGGALRLEVLDAANEDPADARQHGVHLRAATLKLADGQEYRLFPL